MSLVVTGSHLTPALAVIDELKKRGEKKIYYLGRRYTLEGVKIPSVESRLLPKKGVKFIPIPAGRLQRRFTRYTIPSLLRIPLGILASFYYLLKIRPKAVISFGGYVSVPVVFTARILGIPSLTHEQTTVLGLANKINSFFTDKIAISFPESARFFPSQKTVFTGNPIRKEIFTAQKPLFKLDPKRKTIYITGGSQGASIINKNVFAALPWLAKQYNVIHQCGTKDFPLLKRKKKKLPLDCQEHYFLVDYIFPENIGWVLKKADLVVSRGGANTITELLALKKRALIIPIPWTTHHEQEKNARLIKKAGLGDILPQGKLTPLTLRRQIKRLLNQPLQPTAYLKKFKPQPSAKLIVDHLYELLNS